MLKAKDLNILEEIEKLTINENNKDLNDYDNYDGYKYFYYLMKDFEALGIDTDKVINEADFKRYENLVIKLYELEQIQIMGLPAFIDNFISKGQDKDNVY